MIFQPFYHHSHHPAINFSIPSYVFNAKKFLVDLVVNFVLFPPIKSSVMSNIKFLSNLVMVVLSIEVNDLALLQL